jgi:hypothetical protein
MIDQLRRRADRALHAPRLRNLLAAIPAAHHGDPREMRSWLNAAQGIDPELDRSPEFGAAFAAVDQAARAVELQHEAARLYHDPAIRKAAGDKLDWYWQHPQEAFQALVDQSAAHGLPRELDRALDVIGEARVFADEIGMPEAETEAPPVPASGRELEFEIGELVQKSVSGTLTKAEDARLSQLYEAQVGRENDGNLSPATRTPPAPDEFSRLIDRSIRGELSVEDDARLNHLAGARAIEAGLVPEDDPSEE